MKCRWKELVLTVMMGVFAPLIVVGLMVEKSPERNKAPTQAEAALTQPTQSRDMLAVITDNGTVEMSLDAYLAGVVLQEMPADFEMEALKAQAVVARTYALRQSTRQGKHSDGAVCTESSCCQAYISYEAYLAAGGKAEAVDNAQAAVAATASQVLVYDGDLIEATYYSCSGGRTEDAVAVWGTEVPYLQSVDSPGEEGAEHFTDTVVFTKEEFLQALEMELTGQPATWLGEVTYTDGGGVATMQIGGKSFTGVQLRKALQLRSTAFVMRAAADHILVTTKGFGHRVGMSQYGADAMALAGKDYAAILSHYYPGTQLTNWIDKGADMG